MTYTVEIKKRYALRLLKDLEQLDAISLQKSRGSREEVPLTTAQKRILGGIKRGLQEVKEAQEGKRELKSLDQLLDEL